MRLGIVAAALAAIIPTSATAEDAQLGRLSWSAFHCSSLASQSDQTEEQERLFSLGYESGRQFIAALQGGRISRQDADANVPIGFLFGLAGPSPDFMLGRIYEAAADEAYRDVSELSEGSPDPAVRRITASNLFQQSNCALLRSR